MGGQGSDFDSLNACLIIPRRSRARSSYLSLVPSFICVGHCICNGDAGTVDQVIGDATFSPGLTLAKAINS